MKSVFKYIFGLLAATCIFAVAACSTDDVPFSESEGQIVIYAEDYIADWTEPGTKSLVTLPDILQKQIHNLYYFFYDSEGYLEKIYYQDVVPTMTVSVSHASFPEVTEHGIICVVANAEIMNVEGSNDGEPHLVSSDKVTVGDVNTWKQTVATLSDFKRNALFPLYVNHRNAEFTGSRGDGRPDHVLMFGFFDGTINHDESIQIPLGRLCARLNIRLSGLGLGEQARVTILNAPLYTAVYPEVEGGMMPCETYNPGGGDDYKQYWTNFVETIDNHVNEDGTSGSVDNQNEKHDDINWDDTVGPDGWFGGIDTDADGNKTANLFYYCGENDYDFTKTKTILRVETWDNAVKPENNGARPNADNPDRTYEIALGQQSPYVENRSFSLYRNTAYTFNIELLKN